MLPKLVHGLCGLVLVIGAQASFAGQAAPEDIKGGAFTTLSSDPVGASDQLPDAQVGPVSVNHLTAFDALRLVLEKSGSGIGLTYGSGTLPVPLRRPVAATNLEGRLPVLVEQLAKVAGFYYQYDAEARVLTVSGEREFLITLPQEASQASAMKAEIEKLGGHDLAAGRRPQTLTYRAKRADAERIAAYMGASPSTEKPKRQTAQPGAETAVTESATTWKLHAGEKLSEVFAQWGKTARWQVSWEVPEMVSGLDTTLHGTFEETVSEIIRALNRNGAGLRYVFYEGNRVLRITER